MGRIKGGRKAKNGSIVPCPAKRPANHIRSALQRAPQALTRTFATAITRQQHAKVPCGDVLNPTPC